MIAAVIATFGAVLAAPGEAGAFTLEVVDGDGAPVFGYRYLVEEDTTRHVTPGVPSVESPAVTIRSSYAPVVTKGVVVSNGDVVDVPDDRRYFVSVLPFEGYAMSGAAVAVGQDLVRVTVQPYPLQTAQISVFAFHDNQPVNSAPDIPAEGGLEGFAVTLTDFAGQVMMDAFGNPLGTQYDANGGVTAMGSGVVLTDENGEALIRNLAPGKYGVQMTPPAGEGWIQTATIEGTPTVDAWVVAGEPPYFAEWGFFEWHVFIGFVQRMELPPTRGASGTIEGQMVYVHQNRPPVSPGLEAGRPVDEAWVALNDLNDADQQIYTQPTGPDGYFSIENVPPGMYQLVLFDRRLDVIIDFRTISVPATGGLIDLGKVPVYAWFGFFEGSVFYDADEDGYRDPGEIGIPNQAVNLRWPDGTIYQATVTDRSGAYSFEEVFPFFFWLVSEVDFALLKATGATFVTDDGGALPPGEDRTTPQPQPENGGEGWRTETGVVLTEGLFLFAGNTNRADWGKAAYQPGENGGISGVVFYATTRAENEPQFAAGEEWEPGIPRVQVNLYQDLEADGVIDDLDGDGEPTLADVDNHPFGWADGGAFGAEDIDRDGNGLFDPGDAIAITTTDSWDDSLPTGCVGPAQSVRGQPLVDCAETYATYNQQRPAIFDGGYAFDAYVPGGLVTGGAAVDGLPHGRYVVEAVPPPGYDTIKEEDRNVDFGDEYGVSKVIPLDIAPPCVGDPHVVPSYLTLFPGEPAPFAGEERPLCDRKLVFVTDHRNAAADFFLLTETPKAARIHGLVLNDVLLEFDPASPLKGNNYGVPWLPISIQDWSGHEIVRTYTDEWGHYQALVPSTYTVNVPSPSGVAPGMLKACLNHPGPIPDPDHPDRTMIDPFYNPSYGQVCTNWDFWPGRTTRLDTPILPIGAFTDARSRVDCEEPDGTPLIYAVRGPEGDAWLPGRGGLLEIEAVGDVTIANPDPADGAPGTITRDLGFGGATGQVTFDGDPVPIVEWAADGQRIIVDVPAGGAEGQILVTRGDNGRTSPMGVTLTVARGPVVHVAEGESIQAAIDGAPSNALVVVAPGTYVENVIMWKRIRLQGSGAPSTVIQAGPVTPERQVEWDARLQALIDAGDVDLVPGERADFYLEPNPGILVATADGEFSRGRRPRIDGFTVTGAVKGGGIFVNAYASRLEIANTRLVSNHGSFGGGIRVGTPSIVAENGVDFEGSFNDQLHVHHNQILRNGATDGGGGVALFNGSDRYRLEDNLICGNFSLLYGGGVAHFGLSPNGWIRRNRIVSNESFDEGGGLLVGGELVPAGAPVGTLTPGAGHVRIEANLIQGNKAGDDGGGVRLLGVNGRDVQENPQTRSAWHGVWMANNLIVNNSTADAGGGISLDDAARVVIMHDTVAYNDSTATSVDAFGGPCVPGVPPGNTCQPETGGQGGLVTSVPQVAGIASRGHSQGLQDAFGPGFGQSYADPVLRNTIVHANRAFFWDAAANDGWGALRPDVEAGEPPFFWDLGVYGTTTPESLSPRFCLLTDAAGEHGSNIDGDPDFLDPYVNVYQATSKGTAFGNFVVTTFGPTGIRGDYHIGALSLAISGAAPTGGALFATDFDGDDRPQGADADIGADEFVPPGALLTNGQVPLRALARIPAAPGKRVMGAAVVRTVVRWIGLRGKGFGIGQSPAAKGDGEGKGGAR